MKTSNPFLAAEQKGKIAFENGLSETDNPYPDIRKPSGKLSWGRAWRNAWFEGFRKARADKTAMIAKQGIQAIKGELIECRCGQSLGIWRMFKCFYCGEFYCPACASGHFGGDRPNPLAGGQRKDAVQIKAN